MKLPSPSFSATQQPPCSAQRQFRPIAGSARHLQVWSCSRMLMLHRLASMPALLLPSFMFGPSPLRCQRLLRPLLPSTSPSQHLTVSVQADRLPRVIRVTFTAYIRRIYVPTFRMVSGFECCGPLAQMRPPLSAGCSSDRSFAYSFLQIPPRGGHPCCSASPHFSQTCPSRSFFARPLQLITSHERRLETCILRKAPGAGLNSVRAAERLSPIH
jgi:hypothetical protein